MDNHAIESAEMLDSITEGQPFTVEVPAQGDNSTMVIQLGEEYITFTDRLEFFSQIDSPAKAREIAGALVAWAHRQEDYDFSAPELMVAMRLFNWAGKPSSNNPINRTRAKWYKRSVKIMTLATLERNYNDLHKLEKEMAVEYAKHHTGWDDLADVRAAVGICHWALRERDYDLCKKCDRHFPKKDIADHIRACNGDGSV